VTVTGFRGYRVFRFLGRPVKLYSHANYTQCNSFFITASQHTALSLSIHQLFSECQNLGSIPTAAVPTNLGQAHFSLSGSC